MNAIEACSLTKAFGMRAVVDGVSFELKEGAFLSIFGPNGAGKTTSPLVLACGYDVVMLLVRWVLYDFVVSA